ncbi:hypothetical protein P154DRAFT_617604 [Amniculicola lignicola CBS 123094]|uniref:Uncharacterized protein n=1 Tax=Amniculicola lignicola CBS 123094 TaxID=1392246 RepID=A0A6A5WQA3_9PLEO|nr:hypothetical protein P154DRAFT_617604 [Amniculicola lignicola CBS 123094]
MAPSPRKQALLPFHQTWHETDATTFDPASLPLSKIPRAWDRKAETTRTREGKEKKVWRRYTLRSQPGDTVLAEDDEPRELDARNRVVKKLRVGAEAMQSAAAKPKAKNRALVKGTRYDRRRSVLPRKKAVQGLSLENADNRGSTAELPLAEDESENESASETEADHGLQDMVARGSHQSGEVAEQGFSFTVEEAVISTVDTVILEEPCPANVAMPVRSSISHAEDGVFEAADISLHQDCAAVLDIPGDGSSKDHQLQSHSPADVCSGHTTADDARLKLNILQHTLVEELGTTGDFLLEHSIEVSRQPSVEQSHDSLTKEQALEDDIEVAADHHMEMDAEMMTVNLDLLTDMVQKETLLDIETPASPEIEMSEVDIDSDAAEVPINPTVPEAATNQEQHLVYVEDGEVGAEELSEAEPTLTEATLQLELLQEVVSAQPEENRRTSDMHDSTDRPNNTDAIPHSPIEFSDDIRISIESEGDLNEANGPMVNDITDGLTLGPTLATLEQPTRHLLQSFSPVSVETTPYDAAMDDATMTIALDDDTALLKDFLNRAAANKANKAANIIRRTSLQNRRDSDAVRTALASPRKVLEDKDPNSPSKYDNDVTLDLSQTLTLDIGLQPPSFPSGDQLETDDAEDTRSSRNSRRSTRIRTPRPYAATTQQLQTAKISVRRTDGNEHIVLKKSEAQKTSLLTQANTRKNKQGAFPVSLKLRKLASEAAMASTINDASAAEGRDPKKKNVRWDAQLAYFQDETTTLASVMEAAAEAESLATPDELSGSIPEPPAKSKSRPSKDKSSTPRARKVRNLGASNGTPGKGLLAPSSLLPAEVEEEKEEKEAAQKRKIPRASKAKKMPVSTNAPDAPLALTPAPLPLPIQEIESVSVEPAQPTVTKERKSRLATPKRLKLPQPIAAAPSDGKENQLARGIAAATPKKRLQMPQVVVPAMTPVVESGLPRRRGRRV